MGIAIVAVVVALVVHAVSAAIMVEIGILSSRRQAHYLVAATLLIATSPQVLESKQSCLVALVFLLTCVLAACVRLGR